MSARPERVDGAPNSSQVSHRRSSRRRYLGFVKDYKERRLGYGDDEPEKHDPAKTDDDSAEPRRVEKAKRREYLRDYFRWLWPHRYAVGVLFLIALVAAGLQMVEPLFMRFIIDKVLLNSDVDAASRMSRLHLAGGVFLGVIILTA